MTLLPNSIPLVIMLLALLIPGTGFSFEVLIPEGASWKFLDDGAYPGPQWTVAGFDDSGWSFGSAQFGFGEGDETTVINYGPDSANKYISTWFRCSFTVDDPGQFTCLRLRILRDDGAVVHLNGAEILSTNMPDPPITPGTLASSTMNGPAEDFFFEYFLGPEILVFGENTIAVEIHLRTSTSEDLSFDFELAGLTSIQHPITRQPRLIPTDDGRAMKVAWQMAWTLPATLQWGQDETFSSGTRQTAEHGQHHDHAHVITGLEPGSRYHYRVIANEDTLGGVFRTAPPAAASSLKFMVYGDTRTYPNTHDRVAGAMVETYKQDEEFRTMAILLGDIVGHGDMEDYWRSEFFDPARTHIRELYSDLPSIACMGNHEESGVLFSRFFPYPFVADRYWSFDYGPAHFSVVDQYVDDISWQTQMAWLDADLAATDKRWKFVVLHEPGWSAGPNANNVKVQSDIQPLCLTHGVAMVLGGHNHYYVRTVVNRIQHITTAGGGAPIYIPDQSYPNIAASGAAHHFCKVEIDGGQLSFTALTPEGYVLDAFTLSVDMSGTGEYEFVPGSVSGLGPVYPNPSNPNTKIAFQLNAEHNVDLCIYDLKGKRIKHLIAGEQLGAGQHHRTWNGEDRTGSPVASGVYLVKLSVDGRAAGPLRKVAIVR